jgi:hypothetical protein
LPIGVYGIIYSTLLNDDTLAKTGKIVFVDFNSIQRINNVMEYHKIANAQEASEIANEHLTRNLIIEYHESFQGAKVPCVCLCNS